MTTNEKIGVGIVGGVILYLLFKRPKFIILEKEKKSGDGSGSGTGRILPMLMPILAPAPKPATTTASATPSPAPKSTTPTPTPAPTPTPSPAPVDLRKELLNPPPTDLILHPTDPCVANGYGGVYDAATNTCKNSPKCGGGTLQLDVNGKMMACKTNQTGGIDTGGVVAVGFSGKLPLTLDNLLM